MDEKTHLPPPVGDATNDAAHLSIEPAFAPASPTDGRRFYEPESRWTQGAKSKQVCEGIYLLVVGILGLGLLFFLLVGVNPDKPPTIAGTLALSAVAGLMGGTTFTVKWWYHSIAKGLWHADRRSWRIAVPWVSATLAMFVCVLFRSELVGILRPQAFQERYNILGVGFLSGYFSDNAIAKLSEIAESLFGARERHSGKKK